MQTFHYLVGHDTDPIAWWQMCVRAAIIFAWALALYRALPRRAFGRNAAIDIVVVVIMGSTLSRALTGNAPLLPALAATATLAALYFAVSWLTRRFDPLSRMIKGRSLLLVRDGAIDRHALRRAQLGEGDLRESLRLEGIGDPAEVAEARLERNGELSVIRKT